tara:strand:- start:324 stop:578 length:255 start_codon:yes stop_codon:yes gene_type:complete
MSTVFRQSVYFPGNIWGSSYALWFWYQALLERSFQGLSHMSNHENNDVLRSSFRRRFHPDPIDADGFPEPQAVDQLARMVLGYA